MNKIRQEITAASIGSLEAVEAGGFSRSYCFSPQFTGFSGHFPDYPLVPAVVQLLMAQTVAEEVWGSPLTLFSVENAKFVHQVRPEQKIQVVCREKKGSDGLCYDARLSMGDARVSSFVLYFERSEKPL